MTEKQYEDFKAKVILRQANEIIKYGRYVNVQIPTKDYADIIYDQIKEQMQEQSRITGKKNTNYMRTMISRIFKPAAYEFENKSDYLKNKASKLSDLTKIYKLDNELARTITSLEPPTKSDVRYKTKKYVDFWNQVEDLQKQLRRAGKNWNEINEIIGMTYFGKEY